MYMYTMVYQKKQKDQDTGTPRLSTQHLLTNWNLVRLLTPYNKQDLTRLPIKETEGGYVN